VDNQTSKTSDSKSSSPLVQVRARAVQVRVVAQVAARVVVQVVVHMWAGTLKISRITWVTTLQLQTAREVAEVFGGRATGGLSVNTGQL
jgi:hypothetical protein